MATQMQRAKDLLFGENGLGVTNFKLFPGTNREATPEQIAAQIARVAEDLLLEDGGEIEMQNY